MAWKESWRLKVRRRFRKPYNKVFHAQHYFISRYRGADFLLKPGIGSLEISAKIAEAPELTNFMRRCTELRPDVFVDIGANIGLYSCILLKNGCVPRAILFEPERKNLVHLRANLLINNLLDSVELHEVALGSAEGRVHLVPGETDSGLTRIVTEDALIGSGCDVDVARHEVGHGSAEGPIHLVPDETNSGLSTIMTEDALIGSGYDVDVARLGDLVAFAGKRLAIKIDVERYECEVLAGMQRTLRRNKCIVQIEAFETRDQVISTMTDAGYDLVLALAPNFVFEPRNPERHVTPLPHDHSGHAHDLAAR